MTLLTIKYLVQHLAQVFGKPLEMTLEQFNNLIGIVNDELFREMADGYLRGNGAESDARVGAALFPFKVDRSFSSYTSTMIFGLTCYRVDVNTDDYRWLSAFVASDSTAYPDKVRNIDILSPSELGERLSNAITYPTDENPVFVFVSSGTSRYACFLPKPTTLPNIHVLALKKPTAPSLVLAYSQGIETSSGSTELEWASSFHIDIVHKMLKYLGLSVGTDVIAQVVEQQKLAQQ